MKHDPSTIGITPKGECSLSDEPVLSEDQKAVIEYFASPAFQRNQLSQRDDTSRLWLDEGLWSEDRDQSAMTSFWMGLFGLNVILMCFGVLMPIAIDAGESVLNRSNGYIPLMLFMQTVVIPPIISFSFATVTPMFWYGSVIVRFVTGMVSVLPGCIAFVYAMSLIEGAPPDEFFFEFAGVMFAQFLTAGAVAVTVQMWSPWTLSHARLLDEPLPPMGTRAMMELTGVAAIGFAVFLSVDMGEIVEGLMFFSGVGLITSLAVISVLIAFLRTDHRSLLAAGIAAACAFATAFMVAGFFAITEFGWDSISYNFLTVVAVSVYGGAITLGVMSLCLWWLRFCGWRCISREEEQREKRASQR